MRDHKRLVLLSVCAATLGLFAQDNAHAQPGRGRMQSMGGGCGQRGPGGPPGGGASMMRAGPNPYPYQPTGPGQQPYDPGFAAQLQAGGFQANVMQQANAGALQTAFQAVYRNPNPTEGQQRAVEDQFAALFGRNNRPDADDLANLADDLTTALAAGKMNPRQAARLARDTAGVVKGGAGSRAAQGSLRTDLRTLHSDGKLAGPAFQRLSDDLDAVLRPVLPDGLVANAKN